MSQNETTEQSQEDFESEKESRLIEIEDEKPKICRIHKNVIQGDDDVIRKNVCVNDEDLIEHVDGFHYCLFHLPAEHKGNFYKKFDARIDEIEKRISAAEKLDEQAKESELRKIKYDFRFVYFPNGTSFNGYVFKTEVNFYAATFASYADFIKAEFMSLASFGSARFMGSADFNSAKFKLYTEFEWAEFGSYVEFNSAEFISGVNFNFVKFTSDVYFGNTVFSSDVLFTSTTFLSDVDFDHTKFTEDSNVFFQRTNFCSKVGFYKTEFDGLMEFEGDVFLDKEQVSEIFFKFDEEQINKEQAAFLRFEQTRLNKPDRIYFNSLKLRPCWFFNANIQNLNFTDVEWLNLEIDINRKELEDELSELIKRYVLRREEALRKTFNQLADNAEANRRFKEAKSFRKNALALDGNIKCHVSDLIDPNYKNTVRKKVCGNYPAVNEDGGNYFCLLHNPDKNKAESFQTEIEKLIEEGQTDFRGVNFPVSVRFGHTIREEIDFNYAVFHRRVVFHEAVFNKANFEGAVFKEDSELVFEYSECRGSIDLRKTVFEGRLLLNGFIDKTFFTNRKLTKINQKNYESLTDDEKKKHDETLKREEIPSSRAHDAKTKSLILKDARFKYPEKINFRSIRLRPHYFVGVDASKFDFHDCDWKDAKDKKLKIQKEFDDSVYSFKELTKVCNDLAINYEEKRNFEESTYFRYMSMESKRSDEKWYGWIRSLTWLYWVSSGYGERPFRAFGILIFLIGLFGFLYSTNISTFESVDNSQIEIICGDRRIKGNKYGISVCHGMVHSLAVASFQRPDPKPGDPLTKFIVTLEMILVPLQAALLALAIRRKFMR